MSEVDVGAVEKFCCHGEEIMCDRIVLPYGELIAGDCMTVALLKQLPVFKDVMNLANS